MHLVQVLPELEAFTREFREVHLDLAETIRAADRALEGDE